jgi:hypothetical protein
METVNQSDQKTSESNVPTVATAPSLTNQSLAPQQNPRTVSTHPRYSLRHRLPFTAMRFVPCLAPALGFELIQPFGDRFVG